MEDKNSKKYLEILDNFKGKTAGLFIDDANLFYIQKKVGWKIDWRKMKSFLEEYLDVAFCRYYMGMPPAGESHFNNERIKKEIECIGFKVVTKPLKKINPDR